MRAFDRLDVPERTESLARDAHVPPELITLEVTETQVARDAILKIDRSFVDGCSTSSTKRSVVEASLTLARNLKMTSVAEGVQQRSDWDLLDELGCDVMQGFFIARPMTEEGLEAWTAQWALRKR